MKKAKMLLFLSIITVFGQQAFPARDSRKPIRPKGELYKACEREDLDSVKRILKENPNVDPNDPYINRFGNTFATLHPASVEYPDPNIIAELLKHPKIKVHGGDKFRDAFVEACKNLDLEVIREFLKYGSSKVNVNIVHKRTLNMPTLTYIIRHGGDKNIEIIKEYLAHPDIDVNKPFENAYGEKITPLVMACMQGHRKIVKLLLSHEKIKVNMNYFNSKRHAESHKKRGTKCIVKELYKKK